MTQQIKQQTICSRLNIDETRQKFLINYVQNKYAEIVINNNDKKDVVDLLWIVRDVCTNANEDMFVCFLVGGVHTRMVKEVSDAKKLFHVFKNIFGE